MDIRRTHKYTRGGVILAIAFLFVTVFSYSTSPLYPRYWGSDSAQFQTIGKMWAIGKIPYVDCFDHKGPIIYFFNMLGYKMGGRVGIVFFQIIFFFFTLLGAYKITMFMKTRNHVRWLTMAVIITLILCVYTNGNMCEEYCLPFLMFSAYGQFYYFKQNKEHGVWWGFFYGITVSISLLTRATNAIAVLCGILIITVLLIKNKLYQNLLKNAIAFLIGIGIILIPFSIYFALKDAFSDFWFGTIGYNVIYTKSMHSWTENINLYMIAAYIGLFFPAVVCFPASVLAFLNKNKSLGVYFLLVGIIENVFFCQGAFYRHYVLIAVPNVTMFAVEVIEMLQTNKSRAKNTVKKIFFGVALMEVIVVMLLYNYKVLKNINDYTDLQTKYDILMQEIPEKDKNKVMAYGGASLKDFYLRYHIIPCYKYFILQDSHGKRSSIVSDDIYWQFSKCNAKWILTDSHTDIIDDILKKYYVKIGEEDVYVLYCLKNN